MNVISKNSCDFETPGNFNKKRTSDIIEPHSRNFVRREDAILVMALCELKMGKTRVLD